MVQPEDIDSGHSNFQLGARSGRYHHNLDRLRTNVRLAQALKRVAHSSLYLGGSCDGVNRNLRFPLSPEADRHDRTATIHRKFLIPINLEAVNCVECRLRPHQSSSVGDWRIGGTHPYCQVRKSGSRFLIEEEMAPTSAEGRWGTMRSGPALRLGDQERPRLY